MSLDILKSADQLRMLETKMSIIEQKLDVICVRIDDLVRLEAAVAHLIKIGEANAHD